MKKRILATLLSLCLLVGLLPVTAMAAEDTQSITYIDADADKRTLQGAGTAENPYLISSADDLDKIRYYIVSTDIPDTVNSSSVVTTINSQAIDGYFKLSDNIDLTNVTNWTPIGITEENKTSIYKTAFVGTFDGNNKTISNLKISNDSAHGLGLFTRLGAGSVVKDLTLDTCTITGANSAYQDFGALAGKAEGTTIKNIKLSNITVSGNSRPAALVGDFIDGSTLDGCVAETLNISGNNQVGGIFGRTHNTAKNTIKNCSVTGAAVTLNNGATGSGVAGLVAMCIGSLDVNDVSIVNTTVSGTSNVGGIVGSTTAQLTMDHCTVDSSSSISGTDYVGGMIGYLQPNTASSIQNCSSSAAVNGTVCAGGLVGVLGPKASAEIKNSYATGSVSVDSSQLTANVAKNSAAGGLIGKVTSSTSGVVPCVDTCYATGNVSAPSTAYVGGLIGSLTGAVKNSYASGTVTGIAAGGLIGFMNSTSTVPATVDGCNATGTVTATGDAGGLIGRADGTGTIQNSYSTGEVSSKGTVGGLVGWMRSVTLDKVATTGNVTHISPATASTYAGGLAGFAGQNNSIPCTIKNAVVNNNVSGDSAYAFINVTQGAPVIENCYVNTSSSNPFIYYQAQLALKNCFYAGNVSGVQVVAADSYYAKMDFSDITGSYGDALTIAQTNTIGSNVTDKTPKHTLTVKVSPETLVTVGNDGTLTAAGIGTGTLSLVLTVNGKDFAFGTANVTVSAKAVNVTMSNSTVDYDGTAKTIAVSETELPNDLNLTYSYKVSTADDSTYTTTPPTNAGTYTVKVESGNANYALTGTTTATLTIDPASLSSAVVTPKQNVFPYTGAAITPDVTVALGGKTLVKDQDYTVDYSNNTSAGTATITVTGTGNYTGTATGTFTISSTAPTVTAEDVSVTYDAAVHGLNVTTSSGTVSYYSDSGLTTEFAGATNVGTYTVYYKITDATGFEGFVTGSASLTITPATLTITADNKTMYVNGTLPTYTYTVTGWQGSDKDTATFTAPTLSCSADGKTAGTYTITASGADAGDNYTISYVDGTLTVYTRSSGGGSSSSSSTTTTKNPDGSTTTTTTNKTTGTVTEVTKAKDGTTTTVETKKDGTVTETVKLPDGTTGTVVTDKSGDVTEVKATISSTAVNAAEKAGEAVTLPVEVPAAKTTEDAPAVQVTVPKSAGSVKVEVPVEKVTPGTVAVIVKADGTEEIVKTSIPTENGVALKLDGSATVKVIDNAKDFSDTNGHWAEDAISFVTAREMFAGTSTTTFTPNSQMTRAQLMTVLARFDGVDTNGGSVWYEKGMEWAKANGVSDGSNPNGSITREQLATMLWRYSGSPVVEGGIDSFQDAGKVNGYASDAMRWAVETGLIGGIGNNTLAPQGNATRAQLATILMRYCENLAQ